MPSNFLYRAGTDDDKHCTFLVGSRPVRLASCSLVLFFLGTFLSPDTPAQTNAGATVVTRYIQAIQKQDFKTVIDLSSDYQAEIARIKTGNPQALWAKLVREYYDAKMSALAGKPGYWQAYGEALSGMLGDPAQQIRLIQGLILPRAKWKITEMRAEHDRTIVYVSLHYPSLDDSPFVDGKFLKETILEFDVNPRSQLVMALRRLPQGDTQWEPPLMVLNANWSADPLFGGSIFAEAVGGTAPFSWVQRCGPVDLSNAFPKFDALGGPFDPHTPTLWVRFGLLKDNLFPLHCVITVTDGKGQTDTIGLTVPKMLTYIGRKHCWIRPPWFSRGQGLPRAPSDCLDPVLEIDITGAAAVESPVPSTPAPEPTVSPRPAPQPNAAVFESTTPPSGSAAGCRDYEACLGKADAAFKMSQWNQALKYFQEATQMDPNRSDAWAEIGNANLALDRYVEATLMWDKVLNLGGPLRFAACHRESFKPCVPGNFSLGAKGISFTSSDGQKLFAAPPSDVTPINVFRGEISSHFVDLTVKVGGKNYRFEFVPFGVTCQTTNVMVCPDAGITQQTGVANYVFQAIPKLVSGQLGSTTHRASP